MMRKYGHVRRIHRHQALGGISLFPVVELREGKERLRAIKHPKLINDTLGKETLLGLKFSSRLQQELQSSSGRWSAQVDMSAWFDQSP